MFSVNHTVTRPVWQNLGKPGTRWTSIKWNTVVPSGGFSPAENSIRGRTRNAVPSSHSGSPRLAAKGAQNKTKQVLKKKKRIYIQTLESRAALCAGHRDNEKHQCWGLIRAEEPNVSTLLTIWARSLSWADFMSFLITHIWNRASSAALSVSQWGQKESDLTVEATR